MATRKSSTRGKTKTANARASRSSKTKRPSRTRAATTRSATTKTAAAKSARVPRAVSMLTLRRILMLASGLYIVLAVAAGVLMNKTTYEFLVGHQANDILASRVTTVFAPATHVLYDLEIRWAVVALLVISLVLPVLYLTKMERPYATRLRGRVIPWRWIDIAITSALMLELVALVSGVQDIVALKALGGLVVVSAVFGWLSERENENAEAPVWGAYLAALITGVFAWLLVGVSLVATPFYGIIRSPWYVYALFGTLAVGCGLLAINQYNQHRRFRNWNNYMVVERNYLLITTATKVAFAIILIVGLRTIR